MIRAPRLAARTTPACAKNTGSGSVTITNGANVRAIEENAFGILAEAVTGPISIANTGTISTNGTAGSGIRASSTGGAVTIVNSGGVTTTGIQGHGIYAMGGLAGGDVQIVNNCTLTVGSATNAGAAEGSRGIYVIARGTGNAQVIGTGDINVIGALSTGRAYGIIMSAENGTAVVDYSGAISASGDGSGAIRAHSNTNAVSVNYSGTRLETFNANAKGIYATNNSATAPVSISAGGTIITHANNGGSDGSAGGSFGLQATTLGSLVSITYTGPLIDVNGSGAVIVAGSAFGGGTGTGTVTISNAGALLARGNNQRGLWSYSATDAHQIVNTGSIQTLGSTNSQGIVAQGTGAATVSVAGNGTIQTIGNNSSGIEATTQSNVDVGSSQPISAGWGTSAAILVGGPAQSVTNSGSLSALSDIAVQADSGAAGSLILRNTGQMTGIVTAATSSTQLTNSGQWTLRRFQDSTGSGQRDAWQVAIANPGTSQANIIDNSGTLLLAPQPGSSATIRAPADAIVSFDTTGAYLPLGQAANTPHAGWRRARPIAVCEDVHKQRHRRRCWRRHRCR